jgi:hypothetical protein
LGGRRVEENGKMIAQLHRWVMAGFVAVASLGVVAPSAADFPATTGWYEVPNTRMDRVCAENFGFPVSGCGAITAAWNGAVFDTRRNRMIIFGGGHGDYYGNELYAFDLRDMTMKRLTDPGVPTATPGNCTEAIAGGTQPNSRHTYDGIEYMQNVDRMFVFGGSLACSSGYFGRDTWTFDFAAMRWQRMNPAGPQPRAVAGILTAYDPVTGLVFLHDLQHLYSYDFAQNTYTRLSTTSWLLGYHMNATIDPKRRKFVIVGYDREAGGGRVYEYDIGPGSSYAPRQVQTTGGGSLIGANYPGIDYDPSSDRIVAWGENTPNVVYSLDLDSRTWTSVTYPGGPTPVWNGTHGRWKYSVESGVFVLMNRVDHNIRVLRTGAAPARPNPPAQLTVQ